MQKILWDSLEQVRVICNLRQPKPLVVSKVQELDQICREDLEILKEAEVRNAVFLGARRKWSLWSPYKHVRDPVCPYEFPDFLARLGVYVHDIAQLQHDNGDVRVESLFSRNGKRSTTKKQRRLFGHLMERCWRAYRVDCSTKGSGENAQCRVRVTFFGQTPFPLGHMFGERDECWITPVLLGTQEAGAS